MLRESPRTLQEHLDLLIACLSARVGRHRTVVRKLERLYTRNIESVATHKRLARAYEALGETGKAYRHWESCLRIDGHEWEARLALEKLAGAMAAQRQPTGGARQEIFLRHVPEPLRAAKTGMAVAIVAEENIGGNLTTLLHAINRYTPHSARAVAGKSTYLNYEQDLVLTRQDDLEEAREVVRHADFYHVGSVAPNFLDVAFETLLHSQNCVFQYWGSYLRKHWERARQFHARTGIRVLTYPDWTLLQHFPDAFLVNKMIDTALYPRAAGQGTGAKVAHSPTARAVKSTGFFLSTLTELAREGYAIEPLLIEKLPFREALQRKQEARFAFDQLHLGMYGASSLEGLSMGQVVLCGLNNFLFSVLPDIPIVPVTHATLKQTLVYLLEHREEAEAVSAQGPRWVEENHGSAKVIQRYVFIYDQVINGVRKLSFTERKRLRGTTG
jgi:hypothetical protein